MLWRSLDAVFEETIAEDAGELSSPESIAAGPGPFQGADDRRSAVMIFAGFHTANTSSDFSDYRQIGRVQLTLESGDDD